MKRKGQAALEFLTTYGWAILIVLVMIGALSYFGVTDPKKYLPDKCLFKTGFDCTDFVAENNGGQLRVRFTMTNSLGEGVTINALDITTGTDTVQDCTLDSGAYPITITAGARQGFTCDFTASPVVKGQSVKTSINWTYTEVQGVYPKIGGGDISTKVAG